MAFTLFFMASWSVFCIIFGFNASSASFTFFIVFMRCSEFCEILTSTEELMNFDSFPGKEYFLLLSTGLEKIGVRFLVWPFSGDNYSSDPFPFKLARFTFYLGVSA